MRMRRAKLESPSKKYLEKVQSFSDQETQLLALKIGGKFTRRAEDKFRNPAEIVALQLAFEEGQLYEWRQRLAKVREQDNAPG